MRLLIDLILENFWNKILVLYLVFLNRYISFFQYIIKFIYRRFEKKNLVITYYRYFWSSLFIFAISLSFN